MRPSIQDPGRAPETQEIPNLSHVGASLLGPTTSCLLHRGVGTIMTPGLSVLRKERWDQSSGWLLCGADEDTTHLPSLSSFLVVLGNNRPLLGPLSPLKALEAKPQLKDKGREM